MSDNGSITAEFQIEWPVCRVEQVQRAGCRYLEALWGSDSRTEYRYLRSACSDDGGGGLACTFFCALCLPPLRWGVRSWLRWAGLTLRDNSFGTAIWIGHFFAPDNGIARIRGSRAMSAFLVLPLRHQCWQTVTFDTIERHAIRRYTFGYARVIAPPRLRCCCNATVESAKAADVLTVKRASDVLLFFKNSWGRSDSLACP